MDDGVFVASVANDAGAKASNPPYSTFSNSKTSPINLNLEFARYYITDADEFLKREPKAATAEDSTDGEASVGEFSDAGVGADVVG